MTKLCTPEQREHAPRTAQPGVACVLCLREPLTPCGRSVRSAVPLLSPSPLVRSFLLSTREDVVRPPPPPWLMSCSLKWAE